MADQQPTPADTEDERNTAAKSAEDRKAASALANLDSSSSAASATPSAPAAVDHEAVTKAMKNLGGLGSGSGTRRNVKVDPADVALLVDQLDMTRPRATEFLKSHDGDAVTAMRAYVTA
ncbi:unnamed protein product [Clonostachys rosea f. rosea IK726]|jgi:hypothetical protein|uniref:Nascent polypeptide-associated complex subunit alpha-like UBA domain-containing protein n=2 Tax=Bionectria ochroleuca TaxID=29856 RepID=A0A8H7N7D9_BIOOC|nr:unnamed protein product [Clonostachys rosea f. rosea IK726]